MCVSVRDVRNVARLRAAMAPPPQPPPLSVPDLLTSLRNGNIAHVVTQIADNVSLVVDTIGRWEEAASEAPVAKASNASKRPIDL